MPHDHLRENARLQRKAVADRVRQAMSSMHLEVGLHAARGVALPWRLSVARVLERAEVDKKTLSRDWHAGLKTEVVAFLADMAALSAKEGVQRAAAKPGSRAAAEVDKAQVLYALEMRLQEAKDELGLAKRRGDELATRVAELENASGRDPDPGSGMPARKQAPSYPRARRRDGRRA